MDGRQALGWCAWGTGADHRTRTLEGRVEGEREGKGWRSWPFYPSREETEAPGGVRSRI